MTFKSTRNAGFFILFCIIILLCLFTLSNYRTLFLSLRSVTSYEAPLREKTDVITRILTETKNSFELYVMRERIFCVDIIDNVDLLIKASMKLEKNLGNQFLVSEIFTQIKVILININNESVQPDSDTNEIFLNTIASKFSNAYKHLFYLKRQINRISEPQKKVSIQLYNKTNRILRETINAFEKFQSKGIKLNDVIVPLDRVVKECNNLEKIIEDTEKKTVKELVFHIKQLKQYILNYVSQDHVLGGSSDTLLRMKQTVLKIREKVQHSLNELQNKVNKNIKENHNIMFLIIENSKKMMFIGMIVGIVFAIIAAVVASLSLMKPISNLVDATQKLASGDLDYRIKIISKDEIGTIAIAINQMAERLQQITVSRDKLKEAQMQLIQASKLASIGELAAGIAHELNQPLMVIRTGIQMIERSLLKKKKIDMDLLLEDMKLFVRNTKRMEKIINHLRSFSRQSNTEFEPVHMNQVIEDALTMISEQFRVRNISLTTTLSKNLPKISGNANQLEQVILNLLTNARDAIEENTNISGKIEIKTTLSTSGTTVDIYIQDNGKGIPSDLIEKIFNPFYTTKEVGKGTGLGLSISYGIIKDHHGEIFISETGDWGTTFGICLPV